MKVLKTALDGVLVVEPEVFRDGRGFFLETFHQRKYSDAGIREVFVQDNHSSSVLGTIRGLHAQRLHPQGKLVRVLQGEILDVVVDIRKGSPRFRRWIGIQLTANNFMQCYVPPGYAHGFCVRSEFAQVEYKCSEFYDPSDELRILWNDPTIGIQWPTSQPLLSARDLAARPLDELTQYLPIYKANVE